MQGKVKWFNRKKGFGFITTDEGTDIFVHYKDIVGEGYKCLDKGATVSFEVYEGEKGPQAANVTTVA